MIRPLSEDEFIGQMKAAEEYGSFSLDAVERFYDWMYGEQDGYVQVCAFPVPIKGKEDMSEDVNQFYHASSKEEFVDFCREHSDLWRYQVYAGVNMLSEKPEYGRGDVRHINKVHTLSLDIETKRESYTGATKEEVWWSYQYALAQVKYINEEYGVWPMVVMSENGIHLHYKVQFPVNDDLLHNRQHKYSKYITQQAMNNRFVSKIKDLAPDNITFAPDDVSDLPRVMKVPGTLGIKSEKGRLCGIIHVANHAKSGCITADQIDDEEMPDFGGNNQNEVKEKVSLKPTPDELDRDVKERIKNHCIEDQLFNAFWNGKTLTYESRSHAEFAFIKKLLALGYNQSEIQHIMSMSGMTKWDEEGDHYKEKTLISALEQFDGQISKGRDNGSYKFRRV